MIDWTIVQSSAEILCTHCSFERKKSLSEFLLGFRTCFRYYELLLIMPRWKFFSSMFLSRWRCNHFSKKWPKSKSDTTFTHKKTSVTPTFCKRNFSRMNRFGLMNFLSSTAPSSVVWRNRKGPKKVASIEIWKHIFIACLLLIYGNFYAKKWKWIIIDFFRAISSNLE